MVYITFILLLVLVVCPLQTYAQEEPEPTAPPELTYEVEIAWGPATSGLSWTAANVLSINTVPGEAAAHSYRWSPLGEVVWEFKPIDYDSTSPTKVALALNIIEIGGPFILWGFYRIRIRGVVNLPDPTPDVQGEWTESYWVPVINIPTLLRPSRP